LDIDSGISITDNTITTSASNANLEINASGSGTVVLENLKVGTGETVTTILDEDAMGSNSATALATQQSVKAYVDAQDANIASDTLTLTNKTFDAEGTGNALSNVDVANLKSGVLDTDISSVSGSDDTIASAKAIKTYVDSQVTAQDLDLAGDSGTGAVDLDSQSLTIAGGTGLASVAGSQTVTLNIDATVATLAGSQTLTNKTVDVDNNTVSNIEVDNLKSGVLDTDLTSVAGTDTTLASAKAIKTYVDAQVTAQDLDFQGDSGGALNIDLDSETLDIAGGTGIDTTGSSNTLTVAIDATVATLAGSQTLTNKTLTTPIIDSFTLNTQTVQTSGTVTLATSSASVLDSFASATFRSAKYMVSIKNTANSRFETAELLVVHDGTNSFIYSTGVSSTGDAMATYTTDIDSGNVRILVVPQTADSTVYKFQRTLIVV
jgi:hypothetical protein